MAAKFLISTCLIACVAAEASLYGYGGYGYGGYGLGRIGYGYGYARDGATAYHPGGGASFTARSPQGLRGKREAEAEPEAAYGLGYGYGLGLRSYGYGAYYDGAPGYHYGGGVSSTYRSPQGLRGKREAEAEPEASYGYGLGYGYGGYGLGRIGYGYGLARPYATSYEYRSPQGLRGKRSAEPEPFGYGYGLGYGRLGYGYGGARSYQSVTRDVGYGGISSYTTKDSHSGINGYGAVTYDRRRERIGKREAEAEADAGRSYQFVNRYNYGDVSSYNVNTAGYYGNVQERRSLPYNNYAYGFNALY